MRILIGNSWQDGYLDASRLDGEYRIAVDLCLAACSVEGLYFVQPFSLKKVSAYVGEVGVRQVFNKVRSRLKERARNQKYVLAGIGRIVECDPNSRFGLGDEVVFIAPCHPRCLERVSLPELLIRDASSASLGALMEGLRSSQSLLHFIDKAEEAAQTGHFDGLAGWSPYSGQALSQEDVSRAMDSVEAMLSEITLAACQVFEKSTPVISDRRAGSVRPVPGSKRAVLFGLGHYAKTNILPNVDPRIRVDQIHEIDPLQLGRADRYEEATDASPVPRDDERPDVYFIAGYHHTHAPIAAHALQHGADVVIEKPIATTHEQLDCLIAAIPVSSGKVFACFHKRYSLFNEFVHADLGIEQGAPVSYYCIVYEVPLPKRHWYRWPNSCSRLVSNGCHWIDHFLFMNAFCPVASYDVHEMRDGDIQCVVELRNGANFSMVLTDNGSPRIGVQDHVELRANRRTIRLDNGAHYIAEGEDRVLRKMSTNKLSVYPIMYKTISARILAGDKGDSLDSIRASTGLTLDLEALLRRKRGMPTA